MSSRNTLRRHGARAVAVIVAAFALAVGVGIPTGTPDQGPAQRAVATAASAVGLGVQPAAADTFACNYWVPTGFYCGKVSVTDNSRTGVTITDHYGASKYLPPGYHSRGSRYMRDVAYVTIPNGYCGEWYFAGVYRGLYGPGTYGIEDNGEYNQFKVRWC